MKTQFQHVPIILLSKMETVGLTILCTSSCVMNHVLHVCSVLSQPCYHPSVWFLQLSSAPTLNRLTLFYCSSCMNLCVVPAGCNALLCLDAPLIAVWLLRCECVSRDLSWKPISMHNHSVSHTAVARLLNLIFFFTIPWTEILLCHEPLQIFWWADGILMISAEDVLMWALSSCNPDVNCQAGAFEKSYNCYYLKERWGIVFLLWTVNYPHLRSKFTNNIRIYVVRNVSLSVWQQTMTVIKSYANFFFFLNFSSQRAILMNCFQSFTFLLQYFILPKTIPSSYKMNFSRFCSLAETSKNTFELLP